MVKQSPKKPANNQHTTLPPLPITLELWLAVAKVMQLSGQHSLVVEYVVRGMSDKQIATAMGIHHSTVRTYFDRIALRIGVRGRIAILRHVLAVSHQLDR